MNVSDPLQGELTLDPPGRIAVIGAGPVGIEAALYGRYLGYEVDVYERGEIGQAWLAIQDDPLPMLPDRCLSPLAIAALRAHDGGLALPGDPTYPLTIKQWVSSGLLRLASTDLLLDRVHTQSEVTALAVVADEPAIAPETPQDNDEDEDSYIEGEVPPDYRLTIQLAEGTRAVDAEAVIVAIGTSSTDPIMGYERLEGSPYLFRVGHRSGGSAEQRLHEAWHEIVGIFAGLGGRAALDLYRPTRL